jgi:hypothetical protein
MRGTSIALLAAVSPGISFLKPGQVPPPHDPNATLKLIAAGFIFAAIAGGAISSLLTPSSDADGRSDDEPK